VQLREWNDLSLGSGYAFGGVWEQCRGGMNISTTIEGRERFSINVRYLRYYRNDPQTLDRVLVAAPGGAQIPIT
jgi:copper/silver efflux system protein